jgi:ferric-dicitrate binding protein FerR (iron transport regulator)
MKTSSPYAFALALLLSFCIAVPAEMLAAPPAPQAAGSRAGEVSRVIPAVSIARGSKTLTASAKSVVDWQDLVNTQINGRARIALDDGSVLNVGSQSSIHVVKHDAGAQQTELELTYGKLRSQAQKIAKPDGKFEVHTPAGVAGVVGTDFYVAYDNSTMNVIVFEGLVRVCNLAGLCVVVKPGQMTSVRSGDNSGPLPPAQATIDLLTEAVQSTDVSGPPSAVQATAAIGKGPIIIFGVLVAIPAIVVPIATRNPKTTPAAPVTTKCNPQTNPAACG